MLVEIRPIEQKKWHGKTGVESFTQTKVVEALLDPDTGALATGLTVEEEKKYGKLLKTDLSSNLVLDGKPHPFYSQKQAWLYLENKTSFLNTDLPIDYLKWKLAKVSKFVANSLKEYEDGLFPEATHVIYDEEMEVNRKATKVQQKNKAIQKALQMSIEEKCSIIQILQNKHVRSRSQDFVDVLIDEIVETDPLGFLKFADMDKEEVYIRALVLEAIHRNILTKDASSVYYMGDMLGYDYEETVRYFTDPKNQKMKVAILEKLNIK